jgi:urea transporter
MLLEVCQWLSASSIGRSILESENLFSLIETVHVLSIVASAGIIAIVDLRLLDLILRSYSVASVTEPLIKVTWWGFGLSAFSGAFLFWAEADKLYASGAFRLKVALLALVGINQAVFHAMRFKRRSQVRMHAAASLTLWSGIILSGRAIAYL